MQNGSIERIISIDGFIHHRNQNKIMNTEERIDVDSVEEVFTLQETIESMIEMSALIAFGY